MATGAAAATPASRDAALTGGELEILARLMLAFRGTTVPSWVSERLRVAPPAGFTLFRFANVRSPRQVLALTTALQGPRVRGGGRVARGPGEAPFLIAADQEGGQLNALGEPWTQFPGAMAIGATDDTTLAERVGLAIGRELRAVGINVSYSPVLDVVGRGGNPVFAIRSFGDDPERVGRLGSAWVRGLQSAGVAAGAKHFPGHGRISADSHYDLGVVEASRDELEAVELRPFAAAVDGGARVVMSGHVAVPALTGSRSLPATLARAVMADVLRGELGFDGVSISDALDMRALPQDATQAIDVVAALDAGVDLLLTMFDRRANARIESALRRAVQVGLLDPAGGGSGARIDALRRWIAGFDAPALDVVGSAEHLALAREVAERSLTLVRDGGIVPLRHDPSARLLAIMPAPRDLTPADTSSYVKPHLAAALRRHHPNVEEIVTSHPPTKAEVVAALARARGADAIVVGTINAGPGSTQVQLVSGLVATGRPVVTVALRAPWDLDAYPSATTNVATYSILPVSLDALAVALLGRSAGDPFPGRLPVAAIAP